MKKETAEKILIETEKGYDLISKKFSQTRKHFWRGMENIREYVKDGDRVFDFGCGNGRLSTFLREKADIEYWGVDVSEELISKAKELNPEIKTNFSKINPSQTSLALEDNFFNTVYSIAVFHHIPSKKIRVELARELYRITASDGNIIITTWNLWQKNYRKNIFQNWKNKLSGKSQLDWKDCYISFTDNEGNKFQRFHRAFTSGELKNLFEEVGFKTEKCEIIGGRNIVYVGRK